MAIDDSQIRFKGDKEVNKVVFKNVGAVILTDIHAITSKPTSDQPLPLNDNSNLWDPSLNSGAGGIRPIKAGEFRYDSHQGLLVGILTNYLNPESDVKSVKLLDSSGLISINGFIGRDLASTDKGKLIKIGANDNGDPIVSLGGFPASWAYNSITQEYGSNNDITGIKFRNPLITPLPDSNGNLEITGGLTIKSSTSTISNAIGKIKFTNVAAGNFSIDSGDPSQVNIAISGGSGGTVVSDTNPTLGGILKLGYTSHPFGEGTNSNTISLTGNNIRSVTGNNNTQLIYENGAYYFIDPSANYLSSGSEVGVGDVLIVSTQSHSTTESVILDVVDGTKLRIEFLNVHYMPDYLMSLALYQSGETVNYTVKRWILTDTAANFSLPNLSGFDYYAAKLTNEGITFTFRFRSKSSTELIVTPTLPLFNGMTGAITYKLHKVSANPPYDNEYSYNNTIIRGEDLSLSPNVPLELFSDVNYIKMGSEIFSVLEVSNLIVREAMHIGSLVAYSNTSFDILSEGPVTVYKDAATILFKLPVTQGLEGQIMSLPEIGASDPYQMIWVDKPTGGSAGFTKVTANSTVLNPDGQGNLAVTGSNGIAVSITGGALNIAFNGTIGGSSNSFNSSHFNVSSGNVSLKNNGIVLDLGNTTAYALSLIGSSSTSNSLLTNNNIGHVIKDIKTGIVIETSANNIFLDSGIRMFRAKTGLYINMDNDITNQYGINIKMAGLVDKNGMLITSGSSTPNGNLKGLIINGLGEGLRLSNSLIGLNILQSFTSVQRDTIGIKIDKYTHAPIVLQPKNVNSGEIGDVSDYDEGAILMIRKQNGESNPIFVGRNSLGQLKFFSISSAAASDTL